MRWILLGTILLVVALLGILWLRNYIQHTGGIQEGPVKKRKRSKRKRSKRKVKKDEKIDKAPLCVFCMDNEKDFMVEPCKHICLCENCVEYFKPKGSCPMCRQDIIDIVKVYM